MQTEDLRIESKNAVIRKLQYDNLPLEYIAQEEFNNSEGQAIWAEYRGVSAFDLDSYFYRIGAIKEWYRVAQLEDDLCIVIDEQEESDLQTNPHFIRWLSERVEYTK